MSGIERVVIRQHHCKVPFARQYSARRNLSLLGTVVRRRAGSLGHPRQGAEARVPPGAVCGTPRRSGEEAALCSAPERFIQKTSGAHAPPPPAPLQPLRSQPRAATCRTASADSPFPSLIKNKKCHSLQEWQDPPSREGCCCQSAVFIAGKFRPG